MKRKNGEQLKVVRIGKGGMPILENGLTPYQDRFIETALTTGFRSIRKIAQHAKVPEANYYAWMKTSPVFKKAWADCWGRKLDQAIPAVIDALVKRAVENGDPIASRLLLELKGLSKQVLKVEHLTDEELNARILQLTKETGIDPTSGRSSETEKRTDSASTDAVEPKRDSAQPD